MERLSFPLNFCDVVQVIEIEYFPTVNKYLAEGWVLFDRVGKLYCLAWTDRNKTPILLDEPLTTFDAAMKMFLEEGD